MKCIQASVCSTSLRSSQLRCSLLTLKCLHGLFALSATSENPTYNHRTFFPSALEGRVRHLLSITSQTATLCLVLTSPSMATGFCPGLDLDCRWMRGWRPVWSRWEGFCLVCGRRKCRWGWASSEKARTAAGSSAAG